MNNKVLGWIGIFGAPFFCIDIIFNAGSGDGTYHNSSLSALYNFIYVSSWMFNIIGLRNIQATGISKWGIGIMNAQLLCLVLTNCRNIYKITLPDVNTPLFSILNLFWPLSNIVMLATGITILIANRLPSWKRYAPLAVGLWLPFSIGLLALEGKNSISLIAPAVYSALASVMLGIVVATTSSCCFWVKSRVPSSNTSGTPVYKQSDYC